METPALVQTVTTIILTCVTTAYVVFTWALVRNARIHGELATRPNVVVFLEPHDIHYDIINLVVQNAGAGAAYNVRLTAEGDSSILDAHPLSDVGIFSRGMPILPAGARRELFLASALEEFEELKKLDLSIAVRYRSLGGQEYPDTFPLDFNQFEKAERVGDDDVHKLAQEVEKIGRTLQSWTGTKHLKVDTHTPEELEAERWSQLLRFRLRRLDKAQQQEIEKIVNALLESDQEQLPG